MRRRSPCLLTSGAPARHLPLAALAALAALSADAAAQPTPAGRDSAPVVRAVRVSTPPEIDGVLDDSPWRGIPPITGFRQRAPVDGAPASEPTEVRIAYDENALYFGFRFFDSEPSRIRRAILERGGRIDKDDRVIIGLDTYHDRKNAYIFEVGALGTQDDALLSDESLDREDWNWDGVFTTETTVDEDGWVLEMAIPFTTIRFADVEEPVMGIAFSRSIRRKNETVVWPHIGQDYRAGVAQVSQYATLVGLEGVRRGRHLELKPYGSLGAQQPAGETGFDAQGKAGADLKYRVTPNLTLDLTWNTDFAQVESDNVQINLTRFDLFFPEKREFFLERAGLFQFGNSRDTEVFFSRRVGLDGGILGGGRLTGQAGPFSIGALALRTGAGSPDGDRASAAWNSVLRLRADLRERTTVGVIATSLDPDGEAGSRAVGADLHARFFTSSALRLWGAAVRDETTGEFRSDSRAGEAALDLENDRYSLSVGRSHVGRNFDPALGFVRRPDQDAWYLWTGFEPRFEQSDWAREAALSLGGERIHGTDGELQSRLVNAELGFEFESGDSLEVELDDRFERLGGPDSIRGRTLAPGDYRFRSYDLEFRTNDSRALSGGAELTTGGFWNGTRTSLEGGLTVKTGPHLTVGARLSRSAVSLPVPDGDFTATLLAFDIGAAVSRKLFANALVQWDDLSKELQANIRVDWIHTPGSDLFLVLDTGYLTDDDLDPRARRWTRRTAVMKLTYLKSF